MRLVKSCLLCFTYFYSISTISKAVLFCNVQKGVSMYLPRSCFFLVFMKKHSIYNVSAYSSGYVLKWSVYIVLCILVFIKQSVMFLKR